MSLSLMGTLLSCTAIATEIGQRGPLLSAAVPWLRQLRAWPAMRDWSVMVLSIKARECRHQ